MHIPNQNLTFSNRQTLEIDRSIDGRFKVGGTNSWPFPETSFLTQFLKQVPGTFASDVGTHHEHGAGDREALFVKVRGAEEQQDISEVRVLVMIEESR